MVFERIRKHFKQKKENKDLLESKRLFETGLTISSLTSSTDSSTAIALDFFCRSLELNPNNTLALRSKGRALFRLGKLKEALKIFDEVLIIDPDDKTVLIDKGHILNKLERYQEAIDCFSKSLTLPYLNKLETHYAKSYSEKDTATNNFLNVEALMALGRAFKLIENHTAAIKAYDRILLINPKNTDALFNKATSLIGLDKDREAKTILEEILKTNPEDKEVALFLKKLNSEISVSEFVEENEEILKAKLIEEPNDLDAIENRKKVRKTKKLLKSITTKKNENDQT